MGAPEGPCEISASVLLTLSSVPSPLPPLPSFLSPSLSCLSPPVVFPFLLPLSLPQLLNPARSGGAVSSPSGSGHRPTSFWTWGRSPPSPPCSRRLCECIIMSCCANYEPTRSAMQTSICQKRPIFRIQYFRPSTCRPLESAAGGECPPRPPRPAATGLLSQKSLNEDVNIRMRRQKLSVQMTMERFFTVCYRQIQIRSLCPDTRRKVTSVIYVNVVGLPDHVVGEPSAEIIIRHSAHYFIVHVSV